jgi:bifunctional DNA-binding transcriptional regulator/antitoxin component of YhaV-PrlF toxin-antitoxin module
MAEMTVFIDKRNRALVYIPAEIRDEYNLTNKEKVDISSNGEKIIITIAKKTK